jgi:hypothetical protein
MRHHLSQDLKEKEPALQRLEIRPFKVRRIIVTLLRWEGTCHI